MAAWQSPTEMETVGASTWSSRSPTGASRRCCTGSAPPRRNGNPRRTPTWPSSLGVDRRTLQNWRDDKEFLEAWEKLYLKTIGDPSKKSEIMETLFKTATDNDDPKHVQAAKAYFEIEGSIKPAKMQVEVSNKPTQELTDDQLAVLIAERAEAEKNQRLRAVE